MLLVMECCYYVLCRIKQQVGLQKHICKIHLGISVLVQCFAIHTWEFILIMKNKAFQGIPGAGGQYLH